LEDLTSEIQGSLGPRGLSHPNKAIPKICPRGIDAPFDFTSDKINNFLSHQGHTREVDLEHTNFAPADASLIRLPVEV